MKTTTIWVLCAMCFHCARAQESDSKRWSFEADANFYLIPNDFFILPVVRADKKKLHLEARYNYEDRETFSAWAGINLSGGNALEYSITPMIGGVVGLSNGFAPGFEATLSYKKLELYSETEAFVDTNVRENNFLYTWTDLSYAPVDWLWFGISAQRTRLYQTDLDLQRGLLIGAGKERWEITGYLFNLGFDEPFGLLTLSARF